MVVWSNEDEYPSEEVLEEISNYHIESEDDVAQLFDKIRRIWWGGDSYFTKLQDPETGDLFYMVSTCGWSGNESLIRAMQNHPPLWFLSFEAHHTGGHYLFRIKRRHPNVNVND